MSMSELKEWLRQEEWTSSGWSKDVATKGNLLFFNGPLLDAHDCKVGHKVVSRLEKQLLRVL